MARPPRSRAAWVPLAHGSDATGSLRCPAALCGVATLVPTAGRVEGIPPAGQPANDAWRDFVVARHVEDLDALFVTLTGAGGGGPASVGSLRVGVLDHDPELGLPVHPACADGARTTGRLLEQLGHAVEVSWPSALDHLWSESMHAFEVISDAVRPEVIRWVSDRLGRPVEHGELDETVFDAADRAATRDADDVEAANAAIHSAVAPITTWWDEHDVLVTPTTFQQAWPLGGNPGPMETGDAPRAVQSHGSASDVAATSLDRRRPAGRCATRRPPGSR